MNRPRQLSASFVASVKVSGRYGDGHGGHGLSLLVKESRTGRLSKSWAQRLRIAGWPFNVGLGSYPVVTLATARERALNNARLVDEGGDPRTPPDVVPTFAQAVDEVITMHSPGWKHEKTEKRWRATISTYVLPVLKGKLVSEVTTSDVMGILAPIWLAKPETAQKVRERVGMVLKWAKAKGFRKDNPAGPEILEAIPKQAEPTRHHRALPYADVGWAIEKIKATDAFWSTQLCAIFLTLTAGRSGEARLATWAEINEQERTWIFPASRMKQRIEHRVPLSDTAMEALLEARDFKFPNFPEDDLEGLVFPSPTGKALTDSTISKLFWENQIGCVPHGMRTSFRMWAAERTDVHPQIAEHALAHLENSASVRAYQRSDYFEKRRELMESWADFIKKNTLPAGWG